MPLIAATSIRPDTNRIILAGPPGAGKSTAALTFPRPMVAFLFDPHIEAYAGEEGVEVYHCPPDSFDLRVAGPAGNLVKTGTADVIGAPRGEPLAYQQFARDATELVSSGKLAAVRTVVLDSATYLEHHITSRIEYLGNLTAGITKDHAAAVRRPFINAVLQFSSTPALRDKVVLLIVHAVDKVDQGGNVLETQLGLYGKLRQLVPAGFADVLRLYSEKISGKRVFFAETIPSPKHPWIKASPRIAALPSPLTVTIDRSRPLVGQGLGGVFAKE